MGTLYILWKHSICISLAIFYNKRLFNVFQLIIEYSTTEYIYGILLVY